MGEDVKDKNKYIDPHGNESPLSEFIEDIHILTEDTKGVELAYSQMMEIIQKQMHGSTPLSLSKLEIEIAALLESNKDGRHLMILIMSFLNTALSSLANLQKAPEDNVN